MNTLREIIKKRREKKERERKHIEALIRVHEYMKEPCKFIFKEESNG